MPKEILETPSAPSPVGPYSLAVEASGLVFVSGQVGLQPDGGRAADDIESQTRQVLDNVGAILSDVGLDYGDVVKVTVFLADMGDYPTVNDIYGTYFGESLPARSAVQVAALPAGFRIEIEVIAARRDT
ncbi:MAG: RidA family protein [Actinomycetota bacterium]